MRIKKRAILFLMTASVCLLSLACVVFASELSLSKEMYGENAPDFPSVKEYTGEYYFEDSNASAITGYEEVDDFFAYLKANDPDFIVYSEPYIDETPSMYTLEEELSKFGKADNIKDFYKKTYDIEQALYKTVNLSVKTHEKIVKETTTASFYMDDERYLGRSYSPFTSIDAAYIGALDNDSSVETMLSIIKSMSGILGRSNDKIVKNGDNDFTMTFDDKYGVIEGEEYVKYDSVVVMKIKYDMETECMSMTVNEEVPKLGLNVFSMYEVAKVGDNCYIYQTESERGIVNASIVNDDKADYTFSTLKYPVNYTAEDSIMGNIPSDYEKWIRESSDVDSVLSSKDGVVTAEVTGKKPVVLEK